MDLTELYSPDKRVVGLKQVQRFARMGMLQSVYIAKDADETVIDKLKQVCTKHAVPCDMTLTMHQIGNACRIEVGSSCAGVLKAEAASCPDVR